MSEFHLSVCPHDTAKNLLGWFVLNTYLQRRLEVGIRFEPQENFLNERAQVLDGQGTIVYANPYSALVFARERGFLPVAKAVGVYDETFLVARPGFTVDAAAPLRVASATDKLIIHHLGLSLLRQQGVDLARVQFQFVGTHAKAAQAVLQGEAELGFVFNETWHGLADGTRRQLQLLGETRQGQAYHCFCIAPAWAARRQSVQDVLCGMADDPAGQKVLADLRFQGFEALPADALHGLEQLVAEFAA